MLVLDGARDWRRQRLRGKPTWIVPADSRADALLDEARTRVDPGERKALYEKAAEALLDRGSIIYVYHRRWIIAHTAKLEGFKLLPDGLVRVVGLKLK